MSEIELNSLDLKIAMNKNVNNASGDAVPSCSFQTESSSPTAIESDPKFENGFKTTKSAECDDISIRTISEFDDSSSENNEDTENPDTSKQIDKTDVPENISDLISKMTLCLPGAIANPNRLCQTQFLAAENSNTPRIRNVTIDDSEQIDIGNKIETRVGGDIVVNQIFHPGSEKYANSNASNNEHSKNKIEKKLQNRWQRRYSLVVLTVAIFFVAFLLLVKLIMNLFDAGPDGLVIVPRQNWSPNQMVKPLRNLSLPVEMVIISHTLTKDCTNRLDCASIVRTVQDREFNFLVGDDGNVFEGSGWNKKGSHTNSYFNKRSICFAFIGTFDKYPPSVRQIENVKKMIADGVRLGKVMENYKLNAACQLAYSVGFGAALNDEIKNWTHYVDRIDKPKKEKNHNRRQKRSAKRKKHKNSKSVLKPSCYHHSQ